MKYKLRWVRQFIKLPIMIPANDAIELIKCELQHKMPSKQLMEKYNK